MSQFSFRFPRAYRLKPVGQREEDALSLLRIGASNQSVIVPYSPDLDYVVVSSGGAALPIESRDFRVETLGALPSLWARLRLAFFVQEKEISEIRRVFSFLGGPESERKRFTRYNQDRMNIGVVVDSDLAAKHPELLYGWPAEVTSGIPSHGWSRRRAGRGRCPYLLRGHLARHRRGAPGPDDPLRSDRHDSCGS